MNRTREPPRPLTTPLKPSTRLQCRLRERPRASLELIDLTDVPADFVPPPHCGLTHALMDGFRRASLPDPDDAAEARRHSAAFADLRGLPPVLVQAATLDYLYRNSLDLLAKAQADGVANWETDIHDDMPHIFMTVSTSALPYAAVGVQRLAAYAAKQIQSRRA